MQRNRYTRFFLLVFTFCLVADFCEAQLGFSFDIPKPRQYEDRQLRSEKSNKKFTVPKRFFQNTFTHYNYFFNANNKLNEIITRAKEVHKDDYTQLLSFYNYDLEETAKDSTQLDSVIYKATSGIVLHDLRNDWADNLYLLWGAAHYLQKRFDSAYLTFQFINYAFAPKEKDGYYQYIGSNMDGNNAISISTNEKANLPKKILSRPPSRNEAFIWQIRNFLAWEQYPEAATLIATLKADPLFPQRLQNDLEEVQALYFYKQNLWDSSATHLVKALSNTTTAQEKARWEYLAGQMYERSGKDDLAQRYYEHAAGTTVDPVMAVYARLNSIEVDKTGGDHYIEKNVAELMKMAKHDRFVDYRDIIYYMAAEMELQRNNTGGAQELLLKSAKYSDGNIEQRNKTYLLLADLAFQNKDYQHSYNYYDSLVLTDPALKDTKAITRKKDILRNLVTQTEIIDRQDSLQRIAALPEEQRKDFVKKVLKDIRKQAGLKENETVITGGTGTASNVDLFSTQSSSKDDWYFYNTPLRTRGAIDFKTQWGNRPNVDNWRRIQAVMNQGTLRSNNNNNNANSINTPNGSQKPNGSQELTFDNLYANLPLTDEQLKVSNDSIQNAMFELGKIYAGDIEDCGAVITTYEELRNKYPQFSKMDEVLFHLYYCYNKNGDVAKSAQLKSDMNSKYSSSNYTKIVTTGKDPKTKLDEEATKTYENIYELFIEGKFDEAVAQKKIADSIHGESYWTPQLLYIESVYYIKQKNDSVAIAELKKIDARYPNSPLAEKAATMIDVLSRRKQIEEELTNLDVKRYEPDVIKQPSRDTTRAVVVNRPGVIKTDTSAIKKPFTTIIKTDSVKKKTVAPILAFSFNLQAPEYVVIVLNKVDVVFGNETKNAFARYNSEKFYNKTFDISIENIDSVNKLVLIKPFENVQAAMDYISLAKPKASTEIIPWLKPDKYSFLIISEQNLEVLKSNPDLTAYKLFLDQNLPGKF